MFGPYGDESPEELRTLVRVNVVMVISFVGFWALFFAVMVFGVGRPEQACRIPERCAVEEKARGWDGE